ncbi:MAG: tRNA-dihydrouridine synthase [Candidatus Magasanikbacteria bacterium]|nr:tRNA-dihydrouridine synthase [Candidatus Magasanikbacteria bacterium]
MISGFWQALPRPIWALAPLANVTDAAFRQIIAKYGKPDVMFTEFTSADGLLSAGREKLLIDLQYTEAERPIVAQIFGAKPENFYRVALLLQERKFDGIDLNLGCPDKNVLKQGAGGALIEQPTLAQEIIAATKRGAGPLPVSIKTRLGRRRDQLDEWLPYLLEAEPAAITIHARTCRELSRVPARWERVAEAVAIRDRYDASPHRTLIIGNGDIKTIAEGRQKIAATGADGVMIGRGIFGNPWLFANCHTKEVAQQSVYHDRATELEMTGLETTPTVAEKLRVMVEHTKLFEELLGNDKNFDLMKKHYQAYANGFPGAKELRIKLMTGAEDAEAVENIVEEFVDQLTILPAHPESRGIPPPI